MIDGDPKKSSRHPKRRNGYDGHIGGRLRDLRTLRGISQGELAGKLGLSFQQLQKYESGTNRISAGRLFEIACLLDVQIAYFVEGMTQESRGGLEIPEALPERNSDIRTILDYFASIKDRRVRQRILQLMGAIADLSTDEESGPVDP